MSDRYLYKAKRTDNREWVEGGYIKTENAHLIIFDGKICGDNTFLSEPYEYAEIHRATLCQCTGLPDKDRTIMYENDVVRTSDGVRGVVKFGKYGDMKTDYGFYIEWDKTQPYWRNDICYWQDEIEVVGNIFDNPELLEGGAE